MRFRNCLLLFTFLSATLLLSVVQSEAVLTLCFLSAVLVCVSGSFAVIADLLGRRNFTVLVLLLIWSASGSVQHLLAVSFVGQCEGVEVGPGIATVPITP